MFDTNKLNKAGALWQTLGLLSAQYDGLNLLVLISSKRAAMFIGRTT